MRKLALSTFAWTTVFGVATVAWGQNCHSTINHTYKQSYEQNSIWPTQYVNAPRRAICDTFAAMTNSGWRQHNMLGKYHFNAEGTELSEAGEVKVRWIATQAAPHRRNLFVQQGGSADATAARVEAVQRFVSGGYPMAGEPVNVQETHRQLEGYPAASVDNVFVGFTANARPPMLPESGGGESGGSGE